MDIEYYTTSANLLLWQDHYEKGEKKDFIQCERSFIPIILIPFSYQVHPIQLPISSHPEAAVLDPWVTRRMGGDTPGGDRLKQATI